MIRKNRSNMRTYQTIHYVVVTVVLLLLLQQQLFVCCNAYNRIPCTEQDQLEFQFPNCYVPDMNPNLFMYEASFLFSHDAATGYMMSSSSSTSNIIPKAISAYSQNQIGTMYEQLQNGIRAFDLRPYLYLNGTIGFQHGIIRIPVSMDTILNDIIAWTSQNPTELVLLLTSHFTYESTTTNNNQTISTTSSTNNNNNISMVTALANIYQLYGIGYYPCTAVYGYTIDHIMKYLAQVPNGGGTILALDGHDDTTNSYDNFCGKMNWNEVYVGQITCYPTIKTTTNTRSAASRTTATDAATTTSTKSSSCIDSKQKKQLFDSTLKPYLLQCTNQSNVSNNNSIIGPPLDLYHYPFNEIQALWQVTTSSAIIGMTQHLSSILKDTVQSNLHEYIIDMIYNEDDDNNGFSRNNPISLLATDYSIYHGNALFSVLRNRCGQSILSLSDNNSNEQQQLCGQALTKPTLHKSTFYSRNRTLILVLSVVFGSLVGVKGGSRCVKIYRQRQFNHQHQKEQQEPNTCIHPTIVDTSISTPFTAIDEGNSLSSRMESLLPPLA